MSNQFYEEKLMTLSDIRRLDGHIEGTIRLTRSDAANILDALKEWDFAPDKEGGAKELDDDEVDLMDPDTLIDEDDLKRPEASSLKGTVFWDFFWKSGSYV